MIKSIITWIFSITIIGVLLIQINSCKKDDNDPSEDDSKSVPVLTTCAVSEITANTAICGGNIISDGGSPIIARGVCWSIYSNPTTLNTKTSNGTGTGLYTSNLNSLTTRTTYHIRAYATNSIGTAYGNDTSFTTLDDGTITDIDGNVYKTIQIGTQIWMAENLKTTQLNSGTSILNVTNADTWMETTSPAYCYYNNNIGAKDVFGALYNWYVVNTGTLCPSGWHVPTDEEWTTLVDYLGGASIAGGKLKETGTDHWFSPNEGATNESGFTGIGGGDRHSIGLFYLMGHYGEYWSSTEYDSDAARYRFLVSDNTYVNRNSRMKQFGFSVRCVKD